MLRSLRGGQGRLRVCAITLALVGSFFVFDRAAAAMGLAERALGSNDVARLWQQTRWGESSDELLREFGPDAMRLPQPLDFGDSYVDVALPRYVVGGVPMVVFFQMDRATHGLKRIQLERPRHGVNPPAFRALLIALQSDFGWPDRLCAVPVYPHGGYQAANEALWFRDGAAISAIFRDTTLQAFEGCLFGPATGSCGLKGQLLIRIGPPDGGADPCFLEPDDRP
jgi:hypothetical protein